MFRATDPKMAVLMWGVSQSVSQLSHVAPPVMLLKDDFKAYSKIKIDNHLYNKENMPGHFKFKVTWLFLRSALRSGIFSEGFNSGSSRKLR